MPTLDLSDEQVALLQTAEKLGGRTGLDTVVRAYNLHNALLGNKDVSRSYEAAIKTVFPKAQTRSDLAAPYVEEIRNVEKKIDTFFQTQAKERADAEAARNQEDFNSKWGSAVKDHSLTAEGEEKLAEFMKKRQLYDPEAAALLYFKHNPPAPEPITPSSIAPQSWNMTKPLPGEDADSVKFLHEAPENWADNEAANVLNELRSAAA